MAAQEVDSALPPLAMVEHLSDEPFLFSLDGGGLGSWGWGRAVIGWRPTATLHVSGDGVGVVELGGMRSCWQGDPLDMLERFRRETCPAGVSEPFAGGLVVALSYELRCWTEPSLRWRAPPANSLVLYAARYDGLLSYDYATSRYEWGTAACMEAPAGWLRAKEAPPFRRRDSQARIHPSSTKEEHARAVARALGYIAAGDIYQVNLALQLVADRQPDAHGLYAAMQRQHPMPFSAYVDCGTLALASNSPECFLLRDRRTLTTYPIKGTRPRSVDSMTDRRLAADLQADPKEAAEHVMIVDLERSDLGRICKTASVRVDELAALHSFPSLHHLISKVSGEIDDDVPISHVLRATFPGGSITGAPKIRAMQIIDELEPIERGFYTGSIGFIDDCGRAAFNIAIRTAVATAERVTYHAGGGIVADSDAEREYEEALLKAHPFFAALRARAA
jgi:para-aminobenzoate synthetase component 1